MSDEIKVTVVEFSDRAHYQLQWRDPVSGKKKTKSSGIERTGRKKERAEAERAAAKMEANLRAGIRSASDMTWADFRDRHEREVQPALAPDTRRNFDQAFDSLERILCPKLLRQITTEALSRWVAIDLDGDRAASTVGNHCRFLKAAFNWAAEMEFIPQAPKIKIPKQAYEAGAKGRALVGEEHDRMKAAVAKLVKRGEKAVLWRRLLDGLWWSGLRISEAVALSWDLDEAVSVVIRPGLRPVFRFQARGQKGRRAELVPMAPEFAEMLETVPAAERQGRVFGLEITVGYAIQFIGKLGHKANIVVNEKTGKTASAHDYRRSFGTRWAKRVMPPYLKRLMRHGDIKTTLQYYVDQDAEDVAEVIWEAYRKVSEASNTSGNRCQETTAFPAVR